MRKVFGRLHIGVSRAGLAVARSQGWFRPQIHQVADISLPAEGTTLSAKLPLALASALAEEKGALRTATVVLADDLVRLFIVEPPHNAARFQDYVSAAHMRFQALYGETLADWHLDADYHTAMPFLACAVPKDLLHAINITAANERLILLEVVPQFIACWNTWSDQLDDCAWLATVQQNTLTVGALQKQRITMVRSIPLPPTARNDETWLAGHVSMEAMRWNLPAPQSVHLYGDFPKHWISATKSGLKCLQLGSQNKDTHDASMSPGLILAHTGLRG
jgi:hypothetical protein